MNRESTCQRIGKLLGQFHHNTLNQPEAERVRAHLRECPRCKKLLSEHVVGDLLAEHPEMLEPRQTLAELEALAASVSATESSGDTLTLEEIIDEYDQHFGSPSEPQDRPDS